MSNCIIVLDHVKQFFSSGDTLSGRVKCYFQSEKQIREITIKLKGKERTQWDETERHQGEDRSVTYSGYNDILNFRITLASQGTFSSGLYDYPFSFILPPNIPSSYKGLYGSIKYYLKAQVDINWNFDYESIIDFHVHSLIDLRNALMSLNTPITWCEEKNICCWFCRSGPIVLDLTLDKICFVPGEIIKAQVSCSNMSNRNVDSVEVTITSTLVSHVYDPSEKTKEVVEELCRVKDSGVGAHGERMYQFNLQVSPEYPIYNFQNSHLFEEIFTITATGFIRGCHRNIVVKERINVGHITIGSSQFQVPSASSFENLGFTVEAGPALRAFPIGGYPPALPSAPFGNQVPCSSLSDASSAPPTYDEAINSKS